MTAMVVQIVHLTAEDRHLLHDILTMMTVLCHLTLMINIEVIWAMVLLSQEAPDIRVYLQLIMNIPTMQAFLDHRKPFSMSGEEMAPILLMGPSKGDPIQATSRHHIQVRARMPSLIPLSLTPQIEGAHTPSNLPLPPHPPEEQQHHNLNLVLQINRDFLMKSFVVHYSTLLTLVTLASFWKTS